MKNSVKLDKAFNYFKQSYSYRMGGTQTIVLPNGNERYFDDRDYYQGKGERYNSSINHDEKGTIKVSRKDYSAFIGKLREIEKATKERRLATIKRNKRIESAKSIGIYTILGGYIELSEEESNRRYFDSERLAKTLKIDVKDADLLNSRGKTYVFAKSEDGNTYELYHSSLECNALNIYVSMATEERINSFDSKEYQNAQFAGMVGQTRNSNHFVC